MLYSTQENISAICFYSYQEPSIYLIFGRGNMIFKTCFRCESISIIYPRVPRALVSPSVSWSIRYKYFRWGTPIRYKHFYMGVPISHYRHPPGGANKKKIASFLSKWKIIPFEVANIPLDLLVVLKPR